jgi:hypothetical protein
MRRVNRLRHALDFINQHFSNFQKIGISARDVFCGSPSSLKNPRHRRYVLRTVLAICAYRLSAQPMANPAGGHHVGPAGPTTATAAR